MKKNAIVLLITLMFISAISVLILKNLKDSNDFFKVVDTDINLIQTKISIEDTNMQILNFFKEYKDSYEQILDNIPPELPLMINDNLLITIKLEEFNPNSYIDINKLESRTENKDFNDNVDFKYMFFDILKKYKKRYIIISNKKQVDKIISEYMRDTRDNRILKIKDSFIYHSFDMNNSKYIKCNYDLNIDGLLSSVNMIFKIGDKKPQIMRFNFRNNIE